MPPLEIRPLFNPAVAGNQGMIELWVEMYEAGRCKSKRSTGLRPLCRKKQTIRQFK